ncbi:uncharacterized protein [Dermacentor albipictus]|uniref:uncharacterized protein isoform X7 n=1 Tax=Dermacentor albipictus TaxID=60249 RepID=UPI0038FC49CE
MDIRDMKIMYPETSPPGLMDAILQWIRPVPQQVPVFWPMLCSLVAGILAVLVYMTAILRDIRQALRQADQDVFHTTSQGLRAVRERTGSAEAAVYCTVGASLQAQYKPQARAARNSGQV